MPETFRVGLLGHGTVGSAFAALLAERAERDRGDHRAAARGVRRAHALAGRLRGDPARLGPDRRADRRHRPGARLRAAGDAGGQARRHRPTSCCSPRTARSCGRAPASTACSCASRAPWPASCRSSACCRRRWPPPTSSASTGSSTAPRTSSSPRWPAAGCPTARRSPEAQRAGLRRGRPDRRRHRPRRRGQDGDPRPAGVLHAGHARPGHLRGDRADHARGRRVRARPRPRAEADRHRRARRRRASRCASTPRSSIPGTRWRASTAPFNAVTVESEAITEITLSGPGRGRPADGQRRARRRRSRR